MLTHSLRGLDVTGSGRHSRIANGALVRRASHGTTGSDHSSPGARPGAVFQEGPSLLLAAGEEGQQAPDAGEEAPPPRGAG